jgi:hypothetical protein
MFYCSSCGKQISSGYHTNAGTFCTKCEHQKKWATDARFAPKQNGKQAQEDARFDAIAELTADDYLNHLISIRCAR